ncbi:MAG: hypothetical protein ACJ8HI_23220 [Massilia sp.]|jgi:hypothetical protein
MSDGASTTPQGSAPAPAPVLTQSDLEDRVANAFIDSLDEADSEQPKKQEPNQEEPDDAPDDESTEPDEADTGEPDAEPEADEEEGEAEEDSESDEQEADPKAKKQPGDDVTVKMDDGSQVTLRELKRGFLRQSDYTRKTQELAETRRAVESERSTLTQTAQQQQQAFEVAATLIQEQMPPVPNVALIQENPQLYLQQQALREQAMQKLHRLAQAKQVAEQTQAEEAKRQEREKAQELKRLKAEEQELLMQKLPKLRDQKALEAFVQDALTYGGKAWGITPEQVGNIYSHTEAMILHAAVNWLKYQSTKMKAVAEAKKSPPLRPAPRQAPGQRTKAKKAEALSVLKNPGATEDARMAAAMASLDDRLF